MFVCCAAPVPVDVCSLPKPKGGSGQTRWFFSKKKGKCMKFDYKASSGENNFASKDECEKTCATFEVPGKKCV